MKSDQIIKAIRKKTKNYFRLLSVPLMLYSKNNRAFFGLCLILREVVRMARGVNKVILVGNLGRDPETRYTQNGSAVTQFSIATSDSWRDKSTGEQQDRTEWHNIVCFARLAEIAGEYLKKGSKVYIEGSLRTSNWEQDGQKRYRTEVMARELQMLDSRANGGGQAGEFSEPSYAAAAVGQQPAPMPQNSPTISDEDFEDDIPF